MEIGQQRIAELSGDAMALIDLIAASGSLPPASAGAFWPGICRPAAISQTASFQFWLRQSWAISARASSCSCEVIQSPVKQAEMYSVRR